MYSHQQLQWAKILFDYLNVTDPLEPADVIMGFGHFDLAIPQKCYELYKQGMGRKIIFNGGVGSGSGSFTRPEAIEFKEWVEKKDPSALRDLVVEPDSTNTGENVLFSIRVLAAKYPEFNFSNEIHSAIVISNSFRQRRVGLTMKKHLPQVKICNVPPATTMEKEIALFAKEKQDIIRQMPPELDRILIYPSRGFCIEEEVPVEIVEASEFLKQSLLDMGIAFLKIE